MTAEEILNKFDLDFPSEYDREYYTNQILQAMEQYRNEGLREELKNFVDWIGKPGYIHVYYYEVDEYLKQKP